MSVISIIITDSVAETVAGIPARVSLSTNIPSLIFFTLDGLEPDYNSSVYVSPIEMPNTVKNITLKVFVSDGTNNFATVSKSYVADFSKQETLATVGARYPQSTTTDDARTSAANNSYFPFGSNLPKTPVHYTGIGNPDDVILDESNPSRVPNSYNDVGEPAGFSNSLLDPFGGLAQARERNVKVIDKATPKEYVQEISSNDDKLFNPKALVIYHNAMNDDPLVPQIINRNNFSLESAEITNGGSNLYSSPYGTPTTTGSVIKSFYNPRTNEMTTYYHDSTTNRWIISKWQYVPNNAAAINPFGNVVFGKAGSKVFAWNLWQSRHLF